MPNAKYIRVKFDAIDTEQNYDRISVIDSTGDEVEKISGSYSNYVTDFLVGPKAQVVFYTDASLNKNGFNVSKIQVIYWT